jgi:hypothetical protein
VEAGDICFNAMYKTSGMLALDRERSNFYPFIDSQTAKVYGW